MTRFALALLLSACGSGSASAELAIPPAQDAAVDAQPDGPCDVTYSISCGRYHRMGTYARCYGDKAGYVTTDGAKFECTIGDSVGCREALTAARDHCAALTLGG